MHTQWHSYTRELVIQLGSTGPTGCFNRRLTEVIDSQSRGGDGQHLGMSRPILDPASVVCTWVY